MCFIQKVNVWRAKVLEDFSASSRNSHYTEVLHPKRKQRAGAALHARLKGEEKNCAKCEEPRRY